MTRAFVDTTVMTDALLKTDVYGVRARDALNRYDITDVPVYCIKEFKAGPLKNFVWFHNKLATTGSYKNTLDALHKLSRTPKRYQLSTALEGLREATSSLAHHTPSTLEKQHGKLASFDEVLCAECRLQVKLLIKKAWARRRTLTTVVSNPLTCYVEEAPFEKRGLLEMQPLKCEPPTECCLASCLRSKLDDIKKLRQSTDAQPPKPENAKRSQALRYIYRTPKRPVTEDVCKNLGDAMIVFLAPDDATILTTNVKDFGPLAKSLGKDVTCP